MLPPFDELLFRREFRAAVDREWARSSSHRSPAELRLLLDRYLERPARLVRPRVLWETAGWAGADASAAGALSVATEALHVFALMHDDQIDGDTDDRLSVIAGDFLYALGFGLLAETVTRCDLDPGIIATVRRVATATAVWQAHDAVFLEQGGPEAGLAALNELYDRKTGLYTFVAPLQIGAGAGGRSGSSLELLNAAGLCLGRAFQLRDDLTDVRRTLQRETPPPAWELNLAHTWAEETGHPRGDTPERVHWVDMEELEAWGSRLIEAHLSEARRHLALLGSDGTTVPQRLHDLLAWLRNLIQPVLERNLS